MTSLWVPGADPEPAAADVPLWFLDVAGGSE